MHNLYKPSVRRKQFYVYTYPLQDHVIDYIYQPTAIDCGELDGPADGRVDTSQGSLLGAEAIYTCGPSFRLVGTSSRVCQEDETWSGEAPTCIGM